MSSIQLLASDHPVRSVTIFKSSKAEVVRIFGIDLQEGQNKVDIQGLPSTIDTQSVRVSGLGDARLSDVVCTIEANKESTYSTDSSSEVIRLLKVKKQSLESEKRVRDHEAELLVSYSKTLSGEHVPPSDMSTFLGTFVEQGRKNLAEIAEINEKIVELDREIEKETTKAAIKKGETHGKVNVSLWAEDATAIELKLTYIVSNASWSPTYVLHATSENGKPSTSVKLHYRARVRQSTGEDWTGTALTLSTVSSDTYVKQIPVLDPIKLSGIAFNHGFNQGFNPQNPHIYSKPQTNVNIFTSGSQGLFGGKPAAPASGGLFGNSMQQAAPASSPFGGSSFGSTAQQQQQQQPSTGLFGQPQTQTSSSGFGSGFGSSSNNGQQAFGSALFGSSTNSTQPATGGFGAFGSSQQQAQTGGLFGSSTNSTQPATGGFGAFGSSQPQTQTGGLFGSSTNTSQPAFGSSQLQTQITSPPFGAAATQPPTEETTSSQDDGFEEINAPDGVTEPTTIVNETPIAIAYSINGESHIPSDGIDHQVSVAILPFQGNISYVAVPRVDPRVYLQCEVKNTSDYRLLNGPCSVILDDSFVSKVQIKDVNMGDNFECTLGDDPATKVTYSRTVRTVKEDVGSYAEAKQITTYTTRITIFNKHAFSIPNLVVKDIIPTTDDKRAKIILRLPEGLANTKDGKDLVIDKDTGLKVGWAKLVDGKGGEKEGRYEWKGSIKAKDELRLEAKWEIKGPADTCWCGPLHRAHPLNVLNCPGGAGL